MRPPDAPRGRRADDGRRFAVALLGLGFLMAVALVVLHDVLGPLPSEGAIVTPSGFAAVVPTADPVQRALLVSQATWYAATATAPPTATPGPTSTPLPSVWCGVNARAGEVCRWPEPAAPTATAVPRCGTPAAGMLCVWGEP